jgi:hypothetical protein
MNLLGFNPYLVGGVAAVFVAMATFGGCEYVRAEAAIAGETKAQQKQDQAEFDRDEAVNANKAQKVTIDAQDRALNQWAAIGVSPAEVKALLAAAAKRAADLEQLVARNAKQKEKDNENPDCDRLRQVDFQKLCPNRAGVLRGYERGLGASATREDPGPGVRAPAGESPAVVRTKVPVSEWFNAGRRDGGQDRGARDRARQLQQ